MKFDVTAPDKIDYEKEGLIVGLEFHQQLLAPYFGEKSGEKELEHGSKLFCPCAAVIRENDPDFTVERQLRAVSGETGVVDIAAAFERLKKQRIRYEGYHDTTCLVELDEEPIHHVNPEAFFRSIAIAIKIFNLRPFDEIQVGRKTIVDGSNTSGFQRTMQIAYGDANSFIEVDGKRISIYQANLEEDSCKNTGRSGLIRSFRMDRLGIPLIEIATGPDMRTPDEVIATAKRIGALLRTTGFVRRGLGTIRQDINVSIKKGTRIEIKGVQELDLLEFYVRNEAIRQSRMIDFLEILKSRGFGKEDVDSLQPVDLTKHLKKSKAKFVAKTIKKGGKVIGGRLPKMKGLIGYELQPNYRVGTEFSEICKVTAGAGGILHSDELPKFGITQEEVDAVAEELGCKDQDGFFMVVGERKIGELSVENVGNVLLMWLDSDPIPPEVRAPRADGTTGFLRPLPGKARMYPETDSPPLKIDKELRKRLDSIEFELPEERMARYVSELKLSEDISRQLVNHRDNELFEEIITEYQVPPTLVATTLLQTIVDIRRKGGNVSLITDELLRYVFEKVSGGELTSSSIELILAGVANGKARVSPAEAVSKFAKKMMGEEEVTKIVRKVCADLAETIREKGMGAMGTVMGPVMREIQGAAEGKLVSSIVRKEMQALL